MAPRLPCLFLLALLLGLAGCSTTVLESLPTGTTTDCAPAWPGHWQPLGTADDAAKPDGVVEIAADCRSATTKGERKPLHLTLVDTGAGQYLVMHNDSGEPDCIGKGKTRCGHMLFRYEHQDDTIRLYDPDHAWVAAAIAGRKIPGHSERADNRELKTSEPVHHNFIAGDPRRIAKLLRRHPELFGSEPLMVLQRVRVEPAATAAPEPPAPAEQ